MKVAPETSPAVGPEGSAKSGGITGWVLGVPLPVLIVVVVYVGVLSYITKWSGFADKKLWDYLDVFLVPVIIAVAATGFTWHQSRLQQQAQAAQRQAEAAQQRREREAADAQQQRERMAAESRRRSERKALAAHRARALEVENLRAQDTALQAYLDQMSQLLLEKDTPLRKSLEGEDIRTLARARTLTALDALDSPRRRSLMRFLYEARLVGYLEGYTEKNHVVSLWDANLSGCDLSGLSLLGIDLSGANLYGANLANTRLDRSNLSHAKLYRARLQGVDLTCAKLEKTRLDGANLSHATLQGADLGSASLEDAVLTEAALDSGPLLTDIPREDPDFSRKLRDRLILGRNIGKYPGAYYIRTNLDAARLNKANLEGANLSYAIVSGIEIREATLTRAILRGVTENARSLANEALEQQAASLEGAIMPNGQTYEEWLKSEGRGEEGKNSGPS